MYSDDSEDANARLHRPGSGARFLLSAQVVVFGACSFLFLSPREVSLVLGIHGCSDVTLRMLGAWAAFIAYYSYTMALARAVPAGSLLPMRVLSAMTTLAFGLEAIEQYVNGESAHLLPYCVVSLLWNQGWLWWANAPPVDHDAVV